jgi:hypothetical protein
VIYTEEQATHDNYYNTTATSALNVVQHIREMRNFQLKIIILWNEF